MHANNFLLYQSGKWEEVEHLIEPRPRPYPIIFSLHIIFFSIHIHAWTQTQEWWFPTILSMHSRRKPKRAFMSAASWFPRIKWIFSGYSICQNIWKISDWFWSIWAFRWIESWPWELEAAPQFPSCAVLGQHNLREIDSQYTYNRKSHRVTK